MGHAPVMLEEMLAALSPRDGGLYVDATFGAGGYSRAILAAADARVIAIDRDPRARAAGEAVRAACPGRFALAEARFGDLAEVLDRVGVGEVDGVVLDLGVSSMQLDEPERGFSFRATGRSTCAWAGTVPRRRTWSERSARASWRPCFGPTARSARRGAPPRRS